MPVPQSVEHANDQQPIEARAAGGNTLDVLLYKVDRIEETQGMILKKIEGLHTAIYDPDEGLFTRIKVNAGEAALRAVSLDQKHAAVEAKLAVFDKGLVDDTERHKQIDASIVQVAELVKWRTGVSRILKFIVVACFTSVGGFIAKVLYDWILGHVKFV